MSQLELGNEEQYTVQDKIEAQRKLQERKALPDFAPSNGRCWSCNRQIYEHITYKRAANELITGCPLCHRSYCD